MSNGRNPLEERVLEALAGVQDPAFEKDIVNLGLVRDMEVASGEVRFRLVLTTPAHPHREQMARQAQAAVEVVDGVDKVDVEIAAEVPHDGRNRGGRPIKNAVAVGSGKGGVGKTTVAVNVAVALANEGASVGLLDADVYGPNVPTMLGVERMPPPENERIIPAEAYGVKLVSIAFMVKPGQPLVWRGPMLHKAIQQFVTDVEWGELDYLIVDLPPGTGDAALSLTQTLPLSGSVIVTLPQNVSLEDASRGLEMFRSMEVPLLGVLENMSYLELEGGQRVDVFGMGGGKRLAEQAGVPFLGSVPIDPVVRQASDSGVPVVISHPDAEVAGAFRSAAEWMAVNVSLEALDEGGEIELEIQD